MSQFSRSLVQLKMNPPRAENSCGECDLCCDVMGVSELGKPYYARCCHVNKGCTIYDTRPQTCRVYRCAWHMGFLGDKPDWRPDKMGLILQLTGERVEVYEARAGALAENAERLKHWVGRIKGHRELKGLRWEEPSVVVYPYGSDVSVEYAVAEAFLPYKGPEGEIPVKMNASGMAEFSGTVRGLLMPGKAG